MNPLIWEYGHFLFFWEHLIIKNLDLNKNYEYYYTCKLDKNYYDSFLLSKDNRYYYLDNLIKFDKLKEIFDKIEKLLINVIENNLNKVNMYLIVLGCSHQHMHNENLYLYTKSIRF